MTNTDSNFLDLLRIIKNDRKVYSEILKFNKAKIELFEKGDYDEVRKITRSQIAACNELLGENAHEPSLIQHLFETWKGLQEAGIVSAIPERRAIEATKKEIIEIDSLILKLKSCLNQQENWPKNIGSLLKQEQELHLTMRRSFFSLLRLLIDYLKNLEQNKPLVYVVVPAHNEEGYIKKTLIRILNQTYPNKKIVVVDSASTDKTLQVASSYTNEVISLKQKGVGLARNAGAGYAINKGAQIIVFLDADSSMRKDLLEKVWEAVYLEGKLAGISLSKLDKEHARAKIVTFLHNFNRIVFKVPNAFMFATRDVLRKAQFRETIELGEDVEWAHNVIKAFGLRKFKVIRKSWLVTSARRFEKYGYLSVVLRWAKTWPFGSITGKEDLTYFG